MPTSAWSQNVAQTDTPSGLCLAEFDQYDDDGSGQIEIEEFRGLICVLLNVPKSCGGTIDELCFAFPVMRMLRHLSSPHTGKSFLLPTFLSPWKVLADLQNLHRAFNYLGFVGVFAGVFAVLFARGYPPPGWQRARSRIRLEVLFPCPTRG